MKKLRCMFLAAVTGALSLSSQLVYANPGEDVPKQPPIEAVEDDEDELVSADAFELGLWVDKAVVMLEEQMTKSPDKRLLKHCWTMPGVWCCFPKSFRQALLWVENSAVVW